MKPLIEAPSPEVARLCLDLVDEPFYLEHDRKSIVLEALAAVPLMEPETADAFRRANQEGYFAFNALLLAANSSPVALELFRSMVSGEQLDVEGRVELLHRGILPVSQPADDPADGLRPDRCPSRRAGYFRRARIRVRLSPGVVLVARPHPASLANCFR